MVDNITDMATALQEFVQTFYPTTYAQVGTALAPYVGWFTWVSKTAPSARNKS